MKDRHAYVALFHTADDGISISFPDLPGCLPCADSMDEAIDNAREALGLHIWGLEQDGEDLSALNFNNKSATKVSLEGTLL